ncbi:MAG: 5-formyltetrahydrofolate cyclo-ligase [Actinomycetota bacterium]
MTTSADLKRAKRAVRHRVLAARDALPASERERASALIAERVLSLPELERASTVMAFWSFGSEVDTALLIEALHIRDVRIALPRIVDEDLEPRGFIPGITPVTVTPFGAYEPEGPEAIDPSAIDVVLTPGVAFDPSGRRVGYGGGFYDRFFPRTRPDATRLGIAFDVQLIDEDLPGGHFDLGLHGVVTESGVVRFRRLG